MSTEKEVRRALQKFHTASEDGFFYGHAQELINKLYEIHDMVPHPLPDMTQEVCE